MISDKSRHLIFPIVFLLIVSIFPIPCYPGTKPDLLQQRAIKRIDNFIDYSRKTGERSSLLIELQQAEGELADSYKAFITGDKFESAALSLIKLGDIYRLQESWDRAINFYEQAENVAKKANHQAYQAKALTGMARVEHNLKNLGAARRHIEKAIQLSTSVNDKSYLFDALDFAAQIQISQGDMITAADMLNRAFAIADEIKDESHMIFGYMDRGDVYLNLAIKYSTERVFEISYEAIEFSKADYQRALNLAKKLGYDWLAQQIEGLLKGIDARRDMIKGQESMHKSPEQTAFFHPKKPDDVLVHEFFVIGDKRGLPDDKVRLLEQLMQEYVSKGDALSFYIQGMDAEMSGDNDAALVLYLKAVGLLEVDRRKLHDEKSRGTFMEDKIEIYYAPILQLLERHRYAEVFDLMEQSRSRVMSDLLASKQPEFSSSKDRSLNAESFHIRTNISLLQKDLFNRRSQAVPHRDTETIAKIEREVQRLEGEDMKLLSRMAKESPRLQELIVSKPVSLEKLQQSMKQDKFEVLEYLALEHAVILWHITKDAVHVKSVFLPRCELIKKVGALRMSMEDGKAMFNEQISREMFLYLIQPVSGWIKTNHLIIIPHEELNNIPFQVFQDPSNSKYLGESFEISYAPNATVLVDLKKTGSIAKDNLLAVADPSYPVFKSEVESIARLYPNRNKVVKDFLAKESDVKAWAGDYKVIHLSVHGKFNPAEPMLSYLELDKGGQDDGNLTAAEMFGLPLEKTHLVVLSACETGKVEATHANEILGVVRALLYAGADTLILSSWKVDADSTALWMETFYQEARDKPLSEAARLALMTVKKHPDYNHPYYWGPFLMVGK